MKKIWLPTWLYNLKPILIGIAGAAIFYVAEDLFAKGFALFCLGYASWIIIIRIMWSIKNAAKSSFGKSKETKEKTYYAKFPDKKGRQI
jgi:hypothetical protein